MDDVCVRWPGIYYRAITQRVNHRIHTKREIKAKRLRYESFQMWETISLPKLGIIHFHLSFPKIFLQEEIKDSRDLGEVFILYAAVIINLIPFATYLSHQETFYP